MSRDWGAGGGRKPRLRLRSVLGIAFQAAILVPVLERPILRSFPLVPKVRDGRAASSRYAYASWMYHLTHGWRGGGGGSSRPVPESVVEFGPGSSLGAGFAALLSGASSYSALDVVEHASITTDLRVFDELVGMFRRREEIPGEFPGRLPGGLESRVFPSDVLDETWLARCLDPERVARLRAAVAERACPVVRYDPSWRVADFAPEFADMVFSTVTMEHVDDLERAYDFMSRILKTGGVTSHTISFDSHDLTEEWNGHWSYRESAWKWLRGRRLYLINRMPLSRHIALLRDSRLELRRVVRFGERRSRRSIPRKALAPRFRAMSEDDFTTASAFVAAVKPAGAGAVQAGPAFR